MKITFLAGPSTAETILKIASQDFPPGTDAQVVVLPIDIPVSASAGLLRQMLESADLLESCPPHLMRPNDFEKFLQERTPLRERGTRKLPWDPVAIFNNLARQTYDRLKQTNDPLARVLNPKLTAYNRDEVRGPGNCARLAVMSNDDIRCLLRQLAKNEGSLDPEEQARKELRELDSLFASRFGIDGFRKF